MKTFTVLIAAGALGPAALAQPPTVDPLVLKLSDGVTIHFDSLQKRREYEAAHPMATPASAVAATELMTLSGHVYKNARVFRVEPDGITYMVGGGMPKIPFTDLPDAVRRQYGYDPAKAAAFEAVDAQAQAEADSALRAQNVAAATKQRLAEINAATDMDKRDAENREAIRLAGIGQGIARNGMIIRVRIHRVLDEGVLVSYRIRQGLYVWPENEEDGWIYVAGLDKGHADGDLWEGSVYPFGVYKYGAVSGSQNTFRGYAMTPLAAATLQDKKRGQ